MASQLNDPYDGSKVALVDPYDEAPAAPSGGYDYNAAAARLITRQRRQGAKSETSPDEPGAFDALMGGVKRTAKGLETMANVVTGDDTGVYESTQAAEAIPNTPDQQAFMLDLKRRMETEGDVSVWQAVKNVAGATWANPTGAYHEMVAQLPNSGVVLGGMYAGAQGGAAIGTLVAPGAGTVVGGLVGGITGMFLGNTAIEGGFIAQEQAREGEYDREDVLAKSAIKGGFITGVDVFTMGANRALFGAGFRATEKALAGGVVKGEAGQAVASKVKEVMMRHGVNPADQTAAIAAMSTNRQMMKEIREESAAAFWKALPKKQRAAMAAAGVTLESFGEGLGEYGGSALAGLDASLTEAVLEATMSLPQSAAETAVGAGLAKYRGQIAPPLSGAHPGAQDDAAPGDQPAGAPQPAPAQSAGGAPAAGMPPSGQTVPPAPEPQQTLDAQLQAVIDGRKPAMLVTPGAQIPENLPTEFVVADLGPETGYLIFPRSRPELLEAAKAGQLGDVLGYGTNEKPAGATDVVTATDANGQVIQDVVTDGSPEIEAAAEQVAGPGGSVTQRPAEEAIAQRMQEYEAEKANLPPPRRIQAKALLDRLRRGELSMDQYAAEIAKVYASAAPQGEAAADPAELSAAPGVAPQDTGVTQGFTPTHELSDGTQVIQAGEPGLWVDADGNEIEDNYADPIEEQIEQASPREIQQDLQKTQERWDAANDRADKIGSPAAREAQEQFENEEIEIEEFERRLDEAERAPSTAVTPEEKAELTRDRRQHDIPVEHDRREGDRRQDAGRRKRVDEMTDEEKNVALLTNRKTGLPNDRAYEESTKKNFQGFIDVDGLKWINDNLTHDAGDALLEHVGQALQKEFGADAYHISGDEFVVQGAMKPQMEAKLRRVLDALAEVTIEADNDRGETFTIKGLGFSYGIDKELTTADQISQRHKQERTKAGLRAGRGEQPPGISRKNPGQNRGDQGDSAEEESITAEEFDDILNEELAAAGVESEAAEEPGPAPEEVDTQDIDAAAHEAATSPNNDLPEPSTAQKEAGNYQKGHLRLHGLDISVENPQGSERAGMDANGKKWSVTMAHHYGYIKGTVGKDKDHLDVFIGPLGEQSDRVLIIDQADAGRRFDEHKIMIGFGSTEEAISGYLSNYEAGWDRIRGLRAMSVEDFKSWLTSGKTRQPAASKLLSRSESKALSDAYGKPIGLGVSDDAPAAPVTVKYEQAPQPFTKALRARIDKALEDSGIELGGDPVTINFRDPKYGERGGYHPVEIGIKEDGRVAYVTDFYLTGSPPMQDMVKELDFDFENRVFEHSPGIGSRRYPINSSAAGGLWRTWQKNFNAYANAGVYQVTVSKSEQSVTLPVSNGDLSADDVRNHLAEQSRNGASFEAAKESLSDFSPDQIVEAMGDHGSLREFYESLNPARIKDQSRKQESEKKQEITENQQQEPEPVKNDKAESADARRARMDLDAALSDLGAILLDRNTLQVVPVDEAKLIPVLTRVMDAAFRLGYHKFKDAARFALSLIREKFGAEAADAVTLDHLQGAYIGMAGKYKDQGADTKKAVVAVESLDELESSNERTDTGSQSQEALGGMAPGADAGTQSGGDVHAGDAEGGRTGAGADNRSDAGGVSGARSGRSSASGVHPAETGARRGGKRGGSRRTGRDGSRVSGLGEADVQPGQGSVSPPNIPASNFVITDDVRLGLGGEAEKFRDNLAAIRALKQIQAENRRATDEEKRTLARFVGWGGLSNAFADNDGNFKKGWEDRGQELADLLTPKELAAARSSTRNAHYTSETIIRGMWDAVRRFGYRGGLALESSAGVGNFLGLAPQDIVTRFIAVEYDAITAGIAKALYPQDTVLHSGFQKVPLADQAFDLAIGNPPFGNESLNFQFKPELRGKSIHNQFFLASLDALKTDGILAMVVSRYLLDAKDSSARLALAKKADLIGAIRLPDTAFKENAHTEVVTDIIFLRKKVEFSEADRYDANGKKLPPVKFDPPSWVETTTIPDPLGGDPMVVNRYFADNPGMILGSLERSGSMRYENDITVRLDKSESIADRLAAAVSRLPEGIINPSQEVIDRSLERHQSMTDALEIALSGAEEGAVLRTAGGLEQVLERETPEGDYELTKRPLTAESPWSSALAMDKDGRWYREIQKLDAKGKPVKSGRLNVYEREVFASEADIPKNLLLGEARFERLQSLVDLRDLLKTQLQLEAEDVPARQIEANRKKLSAAYHAFVDKHGPVNAAKNASLVAEMPDGALVLALEMSYRKEQKEWTGKVKGKSKIYKVTRKESATPAPILKERVVRPYEAPTKAESPADALAISLSESGRVNIDRIADLLGTSSEGVIRDLYEQRDTPLIFHNPESGEWETSSTYLTGQVKRKLNAAREIGLQKHVAALEKVQPKPIGAENISVGMGMSWVPADIYAAFINSLTGGSRAKVQFSALTNSYNVVGESTAKAKEWGTERVSLTDLVDDILNNRQTKVYATDADGKRYLLQEQTDLANLKKDQIRTAFEDWVFQDGTRRNRLVEIFNEKFNTRVARQHDGSHLTMPGKVPDAVIRMRRHQKNAIWRGISERFMLIDHAVGAGKTFTAIGRAMERRRMGLSRKPMIVVPNHMVEQFASDVYRLYPSAKVLAVGKRDLERKKRRKAFAKIATGDWDVVIMPHSSFGFIQIAPETEERYIEAEIALAEEAIKEAEEQAAEDGATGGRFKPFNVKEAERVKATLEARLDKIKSKGKDRLLTFEQMGVDDLTIDEAHEFKNLFYNSRTSGVRGMGDKSGSQKAFDLYNKIRTLRETPTGTVTFMTGTPISNSAVEMYTMMRYLAADELSELGLEHFDAWRSQYVGISTKYEPTESGSLKEVNRLGRYWSNMRSLMDLYYSFTDAVTNEDIKKAYAEDHPGKEFPLPKVAGGGRQSVVIKPTPAQDAMLKEIIGAFESLDDIKDPRERNAARLRLMDRARKVSLDVRAVDPRNPSDEAGGKLEKVADEVAELYREWNADRGTQLIFLDRSIPKSKGDDKIIKDYDDLVAKRDQALADNDEDAYRGAVERLEKFDANEIAELRNAQHGGWNAYQQIKDNLIARGIPADQIRFIQEANTDVQKQALFDAVNDGEVRVLIGSTPRMGAGTNVQKRLVGLHHVDVTWKPSDIEQREGRIIRQGNLFNTEPEPGKPNPLYKPGFEVVIKAYATERTVDAKMWDLNSTKLKMINGVRHYDGSFNMEFDDEDSVSMAEIAALATGDPMMLERVTLMGDIQKLELLESAHRRKMYGIQDTVSGYERDIAELPGRIEQAKALSRRLAEAIEKAKDESAARRVTIEGQEYADDFEANKAVLEAIEKQKAGDQNAKYAISVNGARLSNKADIETAIKASLGDPGVSITVDGKQHIELLSAGQEIATKIAAATEGMTPNNKRIPSTKVGEIYGMDIELDAYLVTVGKPAYDMSLSVVDGGSSVASSSFAQREDGKPSATMVRNRLERLIIDLAGKSGGVGISNMERQLETAREELPELKSKLGQTFDKADELEAKRTRLEEVTKALAGESDPHKNDEADPSGDGSPAALFSRARGDAQPPRRDAAAPTFYSQMQRVLESKLPGSGSALQIRNTIQAFAKKGEFKAEELEWSGVEEWLGEQGVRKVTKAEVLDFLRANEIQVQDVVKGNAWAVYDQESREEYYFETEAEARAYATENDIASVDVFPKRGVGSNDTEFDQYQLPGGQNYRELLLTLPEKPGVRGPKGWGDTHGGTYDSANFISGHWDTTNVLAHVRFNERTDADGKRVLFIEEVQSDWHQKGRKEGYAREVVVTPATHEVDQSLLSSRDTKPAGWAVYPKAGGASASAVSPAFTSKDEAIAWLNSGNKVREGGDVLDAPFKTTWPMLAMKRMIRYAAENGFDRIAWTTGEQQADRYDLSKQVDSLLYEKNQDGTYRVSAQTGGRGIMLGESIDESKLEDYVGKEVAKKIVDGDGRRTEVQGEYDPASMTSRKKYMQQLSGIDLKVGGEGMRGFYDKILPNEVGKYVKKWGAKVGVSEVMADRSTLGELSTSESRRLEELRSRQGSLSGLERDELSHLTDVEKSVRVKIGRAGAHSVDITPAMRDAAMQGQPLFSRKDATTGMQAAEIQDAVSKIADNWIGGPKIEVVQSVSDLPQNLREFIDESDQAYMDLNDGERPKPPEAMFDTKRTKVWLIADALTGVGAAQRALLHESVGHFGLRRLLGRDLTPILRQVYFSQKAAVEEIGRRYGLDLTVEENRLVAAEEVLAHLAEENRAPKILEKVYVALLNWLRKMGFTIQLTKADLYVLLDESRKQLETGRANRGKASGQIAMSRRRDAARAGSEPAALFSRQKAPHDPRLQSLLNKIGAGPEKSLAERVREGIDGDWRGRTADLRDRMAQASVDQFHGLKAAEKALGLTDHDRSAYIAARMSTSVDSQLMVALMKGPLRWLGNRATFVPGKKGLLDILQPVEDKMDLWEAYMVARRAERLMAEGRENWLSNDDIQRGLQLGDQYPVFKTVAADWAAFNRTMLDFAQDAGLIDVAARKLWENDDYIPFYRIMDNDKAKGPKGRRGLSHQNSGVRMLRGGKAQLNDILENMIMNTAHLIEASMKNHAVRMAVNNMMDTGLMTPAPFKFEKELIPMSQLKPMLVERGVPPDIIDSLPPDMLEGVQKLWALKAPTDKHVIKAMIDGKPKFYYVHDELLLRSLTSIDQQAWGQFMELFRAPKRWLTTLVTADPAFQAANFVRDTLQAFVLSRENITPILSGLKGARKALKKSDEYWEMLAAGGGFHSGFVNAHDPGSSARIVKAEMRHKDFKTTVLDSPRKLWDRWMEFGSAIENANRLAVYEGTVKAGKSKLAAAYEAKDFMDFSLRGDHPIFNFLAQTVPFFNARLQGIYRLGRGMAENPASFATRGMLIAFASLALWALNKDDDRYKDLEEWDKDTYWHFWHGDKHWRFPKPFEVGFIFGTIPERIFDAAYQKEDESGKRLMERMAWNVWQVFNLGALPQTVAPIVEQVANRDFFRGAPIVGLRLEKLSPEAQFGPWTHETSIQLGRALGVSPARIDHLLQGYFGTIGDYALEASDWLVRQTWDFPVEPAKGAQDLPVVKRFYRGETERASRYSAEFYDLFRELDKTYNTIREYAKTGDRDRARALMDEKGAELVPLKMLRRANAQLQKISKEARLVHLNRMMTPEEKRARLDALEATRNAIYKEAVTKARAATR